MPALQREVIPKTDYWTASTTGNTGVTSTGSVAGSLIIGMHSQFNAATTPAEAFRNIDPDDYDLWYEFDDSDEMSYINSLHTVPFSIGGYDLHRYRLERLCEADLLTDED